MDATSKGYTPIPWMTVVVLFFTLDHFILIDKNNNTVDWGVPGDKANPSKEG